MKRRSLLMIFLVILFSGNQCKTGINTYTYNADVIIYGGTSAAVTAAVQVVRMEPVYMILGQSAATIGCLAIENNKNIHELDYNIIREKLLTDGQILTYQVSGD